MLKWGVVLIETYWNVNPFASAGPAHWQLVVLIETYWNVNMKSEPPFSAATLVLIETYWNVNVGCLQYDKP